RIELEINRGYRTSLSVDFHFQRSAVVIVKVNRTGSRLVRLASESQQCTLSSGRTLSIRNMCKVDVLDRAKDVDTVASQGIQIVSGDHQVPYSGQVNTSDQGS